MKVLVYIFYDFDLNFVYNLKKNVDFEIILIFIYDFQRI